jgi:hypothetical protein
MVIEIGARYAGDGRCDFTVWSLHALEVVVKLISPQVRMIPMAWDEWRYWRAKAEEITRDAQYLYRLTLSNYNPQSGVVVGERQLWLNEEIKMICDEVAARRSASPADLAPAPARIKRLTQAMCAGVTT